ncbi:MAG: KamA family radical SAM protein [Dehalococcoidia bacterium]|nr:Glutamate 2,3-aminomutase [Chloroflexota bacterium]MBT9159745.1 Glutamate 2,3-aminomutase [Chloroflexota bacterium]
MDKSRFNPHYLKATNPLIFAIAQKGSSIDGLRSELSGLVHQMEFNATQDVTHRDVASLARVRDCAQVLKNMLKKRADDLAGFSMVQAIWDIGTNTPRPDLGPAFYAELLYLLRGLEGQGPRKAFENVHLSGISQLKGRPASIERSAQLDDLGAEINRWLPRYPYGLHKEAVKRRKGRRDKILKVLGASLKEWQDWHWQIKHIVRDVESLDRLVQLTAQQKQAVTKACQNRLPFGITPYYLSLMDEELSDRDASVRAQVLPPMDYVMRLSAVQDRSSLDFMREEDTSPFDLITRRYPAICILKPFNTCPQICVYCQRNWEIDEAMDSKAFAGMDQIEAAIKWIGDHPAIHEVLITGGDPVAMEDATLLDILEKVAAIPTVERIRIGTRTPVTIPMRITPELADIVGRFRELGKREVCVVTHVQHPYEITPDMVTAINQFRMRGIPVYNQLVYTFYISKRFAAVALRRYLRLIGIESYYTFNTKGKEETLTYRVPLARLMQEQQEEARLMPGIVRSDEAVINLPRLGKHYLKLREQRDLLSILRDGSRVYEFLSWEKNISENTPTYVYTDVPILDYLERLEQVGETVSDYETVWYYF